MMCRFLSIIGDTNIARTFIPLARLEEDPDDASRPQVKQFAHNDLTAHMPLIHDQTTKPIAAFPPGSEDGPNEHFPVRFIKGRKDSHQIVQALSSSSINYGCANLSQELMDVKLQQITMTTIAGQTARFHKLETEGPTTESVARLAPCEEGEDPLA